MPITKFNLDDEEHVEGAKELYAIKPQTVGLVTRGANRRSFFLIKSQGDAVSASNDELQELLELEDDEDEEETADPAVKKGLTDWVEQGLYSLVVKRARDPRVAAQRALSQIGGHEPLNEAAKLLLEFLSKQGGAPASAPNQTEPKSDPGVRADPGQHSVAQADTAPTDPKKKRPAPGESDMDQPAMKAMVESQLEPLQKAIADLTTQLTALTQAQHQAAVAQDLIPFEKSTGLNAKQLAIMKSALGDDFQAVTDQVARYRKIARQATLRGEIGTGIETPQSSNEVIIEKAARDLMSKGTIADYALAVIEASRILGIELEPAQELAEE